METILKEINAVIGVTGSFVCLNDGTVAAQALPEKISASSVANAARVASQTFQALETFGQCVSEANLIYGQGRLILKHLPNGVLAILCARNINLPLLNLSIANALKKLGTELEPAKPTPTPASPANVIAPSPLLAELMQEAQRLIEAGKSQVTLVAMDPVALWECCPETRHLIAQPQKRYLDFLAASAQGTALVRFFEQMGYQANQRFNSIHGNRRLHFHHPLRALSINVFLDAFEMYHRLDLKTELAQKGTSVSETALVLIRLQQVEMDPAGLSDLCALFLEHDLSLSHKKGKLDSARITQLCADDWGWYKTVTTNLERLIGYAEDALSSPERDKVMERARILLTSLQAAPKSLRWQTRASLGETIRWYETPLRVDTFVGRPDMSIS
jgi:predicted regulator of Ras-like GTPase activity (Roadblock/LC7/MglB family)